jgi:hypothetical protein
MAGYRQLERKPPDKRFNVNNNRETTMDMRKTARNGP